MPSVDHTIRPHRIHAPCWPHHSLSHGPPVLGFKLHPIKSGLPVMANLSQLPNSVKKIFAKYQQIFVNLPQNLSPSPKLMATKIGLQPSYQKFDKVNSSIRSSLRYNASIIMFSSLLNFHSAFYPSVTTFILNPDSCDSMVLGWVKKGQQWCSRATSHASNSLWWVWYFPYHSHSIMLWVFIPFCMKGSALPFWAHMIWPITFTKRYRGSAKSIMFHWSKLHTAQLRIADPTQSDTCATDSFSSVQLHYCQSCDEKETPRQSSVEY